MSGEIVASIIAILAALMLATRGMSRRSTPGARWKMALAWVAIITVIVLIIELAGFAPSTPPS